MMFFMQRCLYLLALLFTFLNLSGQEVSFYKENITMKIDQGYFYVTGNYYLRTTGDKSITLVYPFPADSLYGEADSIFLYNLSSNRPIDSMVRKKNSILFKAYFGDIAEIIILISYRQKLLGNRAEYILESTKGWGKPLDQADYQLIVPDSKQVLSFSFPPDDSLHTNVETIYYWTRTNFFPTRNMIFEFKSE